MPPFVVIYILPFTTVITFMIINYLPLQTGVSTLLTLALVYFTALQVELALRNSALHELEIQPVLRVKLEKVFVSGKGRIKQVTLSNEGRYPARMVTIGIIVEPEINIEEYSRTTLKDMLIPGEEFAIMDYNGKLRNHEIELTIWYNDIMDKERSIKFVKPKDYEIFIPVGSPVNLERGIFINTLENLALTIRYLKIRKLR